MLKPKIKKIKLSLTALLILAVPFFLFTPPASAFGVPIPSVNTTCPAGTAGTPPNCQPIAQPSKLQYAVKNTKLVADIQTIVNFLSAGVAIFITGSIIYAAIRYATAGSQPNTVVEARNRIIDSIVALIAFLLIFSFVQWLIPGGIFK